MPPTVHVAAHAHARWGENPLWHPEERVVYWIDIPAGELHRFDPAARRDAVVWSGRTVGALTLQADGSLLLLGGEPCWVGRWSGGELTPILGNIPDTTRFNDAIADARGRVYSGTMPRRWGTDDPAELGSLYRIDPDGSAHRVDHGFHCANGLGWIDGGRTLLLVDSTVHRIYAYDHDADTGELTNRRVHRRVPEPAESMPDGMTLDAEGGLWTARLKAGQLLRYGPSAEAPETAAVTHRVPLPIADATSLIFAGDALDQLYVTTGGGREDTADDDPAGALLRVENVGFRGLPENRSRVGMT